MSHLINKFRAVIETGPILPGVQVSYPHHIEEWEQVVDLRGCLRSDADGRLLVLPGGIRITADEASVYVQNNTTKALPGVLVLLTYLKRDLVTV